MSAFTAWLWSGVFHLVLGFAIGWLLFKRPDLASKWLNAIWTAIKSKLPWSA